MFSAETTIRAVRIKSYLCFFIIFMLIPQYQAGHKNKTKCYDRLGCFELGNPWTSVRRPVPAPHDPSTINTEIYCYTRNSEDMNNITLWPQISLNGCAFNNSRPTVFITHGFRARGNCSWIRDMKDSYLARFDINLFAVNWGKGADLMNYFQAASNTRVVGAEISRFLKFLAESHGLKAEQLHMIGHSLGAHTMAYACKQFPGVKRLTGLDPAQPCFEGTPKNVRLHKEDADFVEVVHTSAVPLIPFLGFGIIKPIGDVDYYINGGFSQPGCLAPDGKRKIRSIKDLEHVTTEMLKNWVFCSHSRSYRYYINALKGICRIWGHSTRYSFAKQLLRFFVPKLVNETTSYSCTSETCIPLGLEAPTYSGRGVFAALTTKVPPFCGRVGWLTGRVGWLTGRLVPTDSLSVTLLYLQKKMYVYTENFNILSCILLVSVYLPLFRFYETVIQNQGYV